jgi:hypothetical protein
MPRPLSVVFLDVHKWDHSAGTPYARPLGGTQSAACNLVTALAARGHRVVLSTRTTDGGTQSRCRLVSAPPSPGPCPAGSARLDGTLSG